MSGRRPHSEILSNKKPLTGKEGEDRAAAFLESAGMRIVGRNIRFQPGEIDIIAIDNDVLVFVEVKTWSVYSIENLEYSIDLKKQSRIIETSKYFVKNHREYRDMSIRFDVVFIQADAVTHIASAFTEGV
ncbi:MAG: YraN family protein [Treponema sp.]|nr:YraN family protein [Treponema sp.]